MDLKKHFEYRSVWMGLGILLVVFFHSPFLAEGLPVLGFLKRFGYGGVDLMVFSSGLGCFYSLRKRSTGSFYLRRLLRVGPVYWLFLIPWTAFKALNYVSFRQVLGNIFFVQYLTGQGGEVNWYVTAMWIYYLLAPVFLAICVSRKRLREHLAMILLMLLGSVAFWRNTTWLIMVTRLPVFYLGMLAAHLAERGFAMSKKFAAAAAVSFAAGLAFLLTAGRLADTYLWIYGLWWYPFLLIAPPVCLFLSWFCEICSSAAAGRAGLAGRIGRILSATVIKGLSVLGQASYGIFLVHILFFELYQYLLSQQMLADTRLHRIIVFLAALLCGTAYDRLGSRLTHWITGRWSGSDRQAAAS